MTTIRTELLKDLLIETKDGEWGAGEPAEGHDEMLVVRGADFDDVRFGDFRNVPVRYIPSKKAEKKKLQHFDILIETAGGTVGRPTGRVILIQDKHLKQIGASVTCASFSRFLRADQSKVYPPYLYCYLSYLYDSGQMDVFQVQHTGVARFQYTYFAQNVHIPLPSMAVQRKISEVLLSFDNKIELNRRINETLEQITMTLYKYWFVDFGPFQDRQFIESGEGTIPEGWSFKRLDELVVINERSVGKNYPFDQIEYIDISSVATGVLEGTTTYMLDEAPSRAKRLVFSGDIIWSTVRPNRKSYLYIHKPAENTVASTGFAVITPKSVPSSFLYCHVTTDEFVDYLESNAEGSAYPAVRPDVFARAMVCVPTEDVLASFDEKVGPLIHQMQENMVENKELQKTRDYLLPRLLSGEIEVRAAEEQVEEVLAGA